MQAFKFTGIAQVGQVIRGHDHKPRPGVGACYTQGVVLDPNNQERGFLAYKVRVTEAKFDGDDWPEKLGALCYIPHEVSYSEWDGRVEVVKDPAPEQVAQCLREIGGI